MFNFSDRERGEYFLVDANLELHLHAVRVLIARNNKADAEYAREIKQLEGEARNAPNAEYGQRVVDDLVDALHTGVYHDAANSMAAVGMLAPLIESLFETLFNRVCQKVVQPASRRSDKLDPERYWDPRWYAGSDDNRQDFPKGAQQLSDDVGLSPFLPALSFPTLNALFAYRNKMFHNGFEWPERQRIAFAERIAREHWEDWFSSSKTDNKPWIFYMSPAFIAHCLAFVDTLVPAVGSFARKIDWP